LSKDIKERERVKKMTKSVKTYLGTILHNDYLMMQGTASELNPDKITAQDRGNLLAMKTALDSAMTMLDSWLEFNSLTKIANEEEMTSDELGWSYDNTKKATEALNKTMEKVNGNGKGTMFT